MPARGCSPAISHERATSAWSSRSSGPKSSSPRWKAAVAQGKAGGEGAWLLSLELLQWQHEQAKFDERAVEFAVAFEVSPPSWEPPPRAGSAQARVRCRRSASRRAEARRERASLDKEMLVWEGVLAGATPPQLAQLADLAQPQCRRRRST